MLTYRESDWAVRAWDWFNEGRTVEPLSFCQFWRTALLWAPIKWFLSPFAALGRLLGRVPAPVVPWRFLLWSVKRCALVLWAGLRGLWLLSYPLRQLLKPVGRASLRSAVSAGEPIAAYAKRHQDGLKELVIGLFGLILIADLIFLAVLLLFASWFWTLVGAGSLIVGSFAAYGFLKSGALGLLWEAAVAAKQGICPPVTIVRGQDAEVAV